MESIIALNHLHVSAASRRYTIRLAVAMFCYVALLSLCMLRYEHPAHSLTVLLAVLPAIAMVAVIVVVGLYLKEQKDEFQRELLIQALLWGMGATLAISSVSGFLEANAGSPHVPAFYIFVLFWAITGIVGVIQRFQNRGQNDE